MRLTTSSTVATKGLLNKIKKNLKKQYYFDSLWNRTSFASGFGIRKKRDSMQIIGVLENGVHKFESNITL